MGNDYMYKDDDEEESKELSIQTEDWDDSKYMNSEDNQIEKEMLSNDEIEKIVEKSNVIQDFEDEVSVSEEDVFDFIKPCEDDWIEMMNDEFIFDSLSTNHIQIPFDEETCVDVAKYDTVYLTFLGDVYRVDVIDGELLLTLLGKEETNRVLECHNMLHI